MNECKIFLVVAEDGNYGVGTAYEEAVENFDQDLNESPVRVIRVVIKVPNIVSEVRNSVPFLEDAKILAEDSGAGL